MNSNACALDDHLLNCLPSTHMTVTDGHTAVGKRSARHHHTSN